MGILSTFCALVVGGVVGGVGSSQADFAKDIWNNSWRFLLAGSFFVLFAALSFYSQRSLLAWYYGQICLCLETPTLSEHDRTLRAWLSEADSYSAWFRYTAGFALLSVGFFEYAMALVNLKWRVQHVLWFILAPFVLATLVLLPTFLIQKKYDKEDDVWSKFWKDWLEKR